MSRIVPFQPTNSNIPLTPNFTPVQSSTGFAQGDMVFYNNGDYQTFTSQVSTASFPVTLSQPLRSGAVGGTGGVLTSNLTSSTPSGGNSVGRNVAVLSNGNIVVASAGTSNNPFFTIYNTSFAEVVSRVTLPTTFVVANNTVGVTALTGGGFVIYFTNGSSYFTYAVYTNTGTVTKALAQDTGVTATNTTVPFAVAALSGGGFVAAANASGATMGWMIFNAAGTKTFTTASIGGVYSNTVIPVIVANNNDTFFIMWLSTTSTLTWYQRNASNTALANNTIAMGGSITASGCYSATLLGDGTTIAIGYPTSSTGLAFRLYNSSTYSMGGATSYTVGEITTSAVAIQQMYLYKVTNGDIFVAYCAGTNPANNSYFTFLNSSLQPLSAPSATNATLVLKPFTGLGTNAAPFISANAAGVEISGVLYLFYSNTTALGTTGFMKYEAISTSTYSLVNNTSVSVSGGNTTLTVGSTVPNTFTPGATSYYTSSNSTVVFNTAAITVSSPTSINSGSTIGYNYDACTLTDGNFVIAYINHTTSNAVAQVYNPSGTLVATVTIGSTTLTSNSRGVIKVKPLASGKFVVVYGATTTSIASAVVSAAYSVTATATLSGVDINVSSVWWTSNYMGAGSLSNDRYIVMGNTGSQITWAVYSNTATLLASGTNANNWQPYCAAGLPGGGFVIFAGDSGGGGSFIYYTELSTNTFASLSAASGYGNAGNASSGNATQTQMLSNAKGQVFVYASVNQAANTSLGIYRVTLLTTAPSLGIDISMTDPAGSSVGANPFIGCELANGSFINITASITGTASVVRYNNSYSSASAASGAYLSTTNIATNSAFPCILTPLAGNKAVFVSAVDTATLRFNIITLTDTYTATFAANSAVSNTVTISSATYAFAGVAANAATAGGVGMIQTNGMAQLNSNYSASVPATAFTARTNSIPGVNGTINGRNMMLYGSGITGTT